LPGSWIVEDYNRFCRLMAELQRRRQEALTLYEPLDHVWEFHQCMAHEQLVKGSNRGGKTAGVSAEVGWAALGTHPIREKYPTEGGLEICCVGFNNRHLSLMFKYLFEPGQFKVWQHPVTRAWHVANPNDPEHLEHQHLWRKAKPIIPRRLVKSIAWENKKERVPSVVRLHNGTNFYFYGGLAVGLPQGWKFHLVWIDEEISEAEQWIDELRPRLIDYNGYLLWSATPQRATETYRQMYIKSQEPDQDGKPFEEQIRAFHFSSERNKFLPRAGLKGYISKVDDNPVTMRIRVGGEFAYDGLLAYPEYNSERHCIERFPLRRDDTLRVAIDPGRTDAGALLVVCPAPAKPKELIKHPVERRIRTLQAQAAGRVVVAIGEVYLKNTNALDMAREIAGALKDTGLALHDATIDLKGGRNVWANEGNKHIMDVYEERLTQQDVKPRVAFWEYGSTDRKFGVEKVKEYLMDDVELHEPLFYHWPFTNHSGLRWLHHNFVSWKKTYNRQGVMTGYEDLNRTLLDCLRYLLTREIVWINPPDIAYKGSTRKASSLMKLGQRIKRGQFFTIGRKTQ
jgi:hypothetical protein